MARVDVAVVGLRRLVGMHSGKSRQSGFGFQCRYSEQPLELLETTTSRMELTAARLPSSIGC